MAKEILLSNKLDVALVDDKNYDLLRKFGWHFVQSSNGIGYVQCWNPYPKAILMQRMVMDAPDDMVVHHINEDTLDNQEVNLIVVTQSVNLLLRKNVKGYHWEATRSKWKAQITVNGSNIFIGRFDTEQEAKEAYVETKIKVLKKLMREAGNNG